MPIAFPGDRPVRLAPILMGCSSGGCIRLRWPTLCPIVPPPRLHRAPPAAILWRPAAGLTGSQACSGN